MATIRELINKLQSSYDGRKIYCQKWHKNSIRIAFRKYKDPVKQFKHTVRYYKKLIYGEIYPIFTFKSIYLINSRRKWFIEVELASFNWIDNEIKRRGYRHRSEYVPDNGVFRNGFKIEDSLVFDNNRFNNDIIKLL